mmetsp:Transcript_65902/g.176593  ORF Transcript_65902/g.176593 Transcript_65902/m.176593 type:complete len:104 (+) Transcript_65902:72-383(+)
MQAKAVKYLMKKYDKQGDAGLDRSEFKHMLEHIEAVRNGGGAKTVVLHDDDIDHFFTEADRNNSGTVDSAELLLLLRQYSVRRSLISCVFGFVRRALPVDDFA